MNKDFLKRLLTAPSPSGFEQPAQRIWREQIESYLKKSNKVYRLYGDIHGNSIAVLSGNKNYYGRIMLSGHCDEIGFMVNYIDENGYIYFSAIGGIDETILPTHRVLIHTSSGHSVLGVIGKKPVHLMNEEEKKKRTKIHELWIDIGAKNKKEAETIIEIGDPITFQAGYEELSCHLFNNESLITSRGLDDKIGSFVVAEVINLLNDRIDELKVKVYGVSSTQEELGMRGAKVAAYDIDPQVGIAVEVNFATDFPTMDKKETGEISLCKGPTVSKGANINPVIFDMLCKTAREKDISIQISPAPRATGTDANVIQTSKSGVAAGLVSVPCRYMHTPCEVVSLKDVELTIQLLTEFILSIDKNIDFIPR